MCAQVRGAQGSAEFVTRLTFSLQRRLHTQTFADACFAGALLRRHPLQTATSPSLHSSQCWLLCAGTAKAASVVRYSESWTFPPLGSLLETREKEERGQRDGLINMPGKSPGKNASEAATKPPLSSYVVRDQSPRQQREDVLERC